MDATAEKKKPGRPRKRVEVPSLPIHGICDAPSAEGILNEFACTDIGVVKKTLALHKACGVGDVEFFFGEDQYRISSVDQSGKIELTATFECSAVHRYYCEAPVAVRIARVHLDRIIDDLAKMHDVVQFVLREDYRCRFYCVLLNTSRKSEKKYTLPTAYNGDPRDIAEVDGGYPLSFFLPSKELKAKMAVLKPISSILVIQKVGDGAMQLTCESNKDVIEWEENFLDGTQLGMKCDLEANQILRVAVFVDLIRSFMQHTIGESCLIKVDQQHPLLLATSVSSGAQTVVTSIARIHPVSRSVTTESHLESA